MSFLLGRFHYKFSSIEEVWCLRGEKDNDLLATLVQNSVRNMVFLREETLNLKKFLTLSSLLEVFTLMEKVLLYKGEEHLQPLKTSNSLEP